MLNNFHGYKVRNRYKLIQYRSIKFTRLINTHGSAQLMRQSISSFDLSVSLFATLMPVDQFYKITCVLVEGTTTAVIVNLFLTRSVIKLPHSRPLPCRQLLCIVMQLSLLQLSHTYDYYFLTVVFNLLLKKQKYNFILLLWYSMGEKAPSSQLSQYQVLQCTGVLRLGGLLKH